MSSIKVTVNDAFVTNEGALVKNACARNEVEFSNVTQREAIAVTVYVCARMPISDMCISKF